MNDYLKDKDKDKKEDSIVLYYLNNFLLFQKMKKQQTNF